METFSLLLAFWAGISPVTPEFPSQRPVTQSFDVSFDLRLNKWLYKPSGRTPVIWEPSRSSWRHCNDPEIIENFSSCQIWRTATQSTSVVANPLVIYNMSQQSCTWFSGLSSSALLSSLNARIYKQHTLTKVWVEIIHPFPNFGTRYVISSHTL